MMADASLKGESGYPMPMRIVLLGFQKAGKSSAGDTILDEKDSGSKKSLECVVRQGQVFGRQLTLVEAPGWSVGPSEDSIELLKQEILSSPALCPPGPHAFLIVVPVNISFTEAHRTSVVKHLELLGTKVWHYAMVLFTTGDYLGNRAIEHHIECEGSAIQWLLKKCSDRYHVLNNKHTGDYGIQVTELLEKIQEMVDGNEDCHYDIDINVLEAEKRKKDNRERATVRKTEVHNKRVEIRRQMGHTEKTTELRLVLMEYRALGQSSAGHFILGKREFDCKRSAECVKRQGEAVGRRITLVEVPDWSKNREITESCQLLQQEIILSTSLCPPGAHAILLSVRADMAFKEADRSLIERHVELLGENVWSHIIVLFTSGKYLGDMDIELHIESEGKALHWLLEKCKNRYHILNTDSKDADIQVQDLLDKVEEMVTENRYCLYQMDGEILKDAEERKRNAKTRAHQRKQKVQQHREHIRSQIGDRKLSELRLVLMGTAGKSSAGNTILGREEFQLKTVVHSEIKRAMVAGRKVTVVESPCWSPSDVQNTAKMYQLEFRHSLFLCDPGPHAVLLVIGVDSKYSEMNNTVVEEHFKLLSQRVWNHTIVLFAHDDWLKQTPIELHIESEGHALQWLLNKCNNRYHVLNNKVKNDVMQVIQLFEKIEEMVEENNRCYYQLDQHIVETADEKRRVEQRAKLREMKMQRLREENKAKTERKSEIGGRLSPAVSYQSLKSDTSIPVPPNFSLLPPVHHSERQMMDAVGSSCGDSGFWQYVPIRCPSEDPPYRLQHVESRSASPPSNCIKPVDNNSTDDIKSAGEKSVMY